MFSSSFPNMQTIETYREMYILHARIELHVLNLTFVFAENVVVSDACIQRALRNEIMILEVLEAQEPAVFRQKLFNTLTHCYEENQLMFGASGSPKPKHFKRTMLDDEVVAGGGESSQLSRVKPPRQLRRRTLLATCRRRRRRRSSCHSSHTPHQAAKGKSACMVG
jgi:hypothetical protein